MTDLRPRYHFTAMRGWLNDPLALTWVEDRYHLFFQHVPDSVAWSHECRWGHAISRDLVSWSELPVALEPGEADAGAWSGSLAMSTGAGPTIFYTSVQLPDLDAGRIRTARALDSDLITWEKGPVVVEPPTDPATRMFRDPFVFRDGDRWRMLVGAALDGGVGAALGYSSGDLLQWKPDGVAASRPGDRRDTVWTGAGWECPRLIEVDGVSVLVISVWEPDGIHHTVAAVGRYRAGRFDIERWQQLTFGAGYYAGSVFRDRDGRACIIFWIRGVHSTDAAEPWAGALSVPHLLSIRDGQVQLSPHPEMRAAADASFREVAAGERVVEPGWQVVDFAAVGSDLVVRAGGLEAGRLPRLGRHLVMTDGPVVEVWGAAGAVGFMRPAAEDTGP